MSTATEVEHAHDHPTDAKYVKIAVFLGVVTGLEVGTYFWEDLFGQVPSTTALILTLFPMMIIKFGVVAAYFMHLKYDNPLLRRVFTFGMVLALVVYAIMSFAFEFWSDDYFKFLRA